jgi:hypothetical protein
VPFLVLHAPSLLPVLHGIIPDSVGTCFVPDRPASPYEYRTGIDDDSNSIRMLLLQAG